MTSEKSDAGFQEYIDEHVDDGWTVASRDETEVTLKKRGFGSLKAHVVILVLTAWWTFFMGNVAYAAYKYIRGTKKVVPNVATSKSSVSENSAATQREVASTGVTLPESDDADDIEGEPGVGAEESTDEKSIISRLKSRWNSLDNRQKAFMLGGAIGTSLYGYYESKEDISIPTELLVSGAVLIAVLLVSWRILGVERSLVAAAGFVVLVAGKEIILFAIGFGGFVIGFLFGQTIGDTTLSLALGFIVAILVVSIYQFVVILPGLLAGGFGGLLIGQELAMGNLITLVTIVVGASIGANLVWFIHELFIAIFSAFIGAVTVYTAIRPSWLRTAIEFQNNVNAGISGEHVVILAVLTVFGVLAQFEVVSRLPSPTLPESAPSNRDDTGETDDELNSKDE